MCNSGGGKANQWGIFLIQRVLCFQSFLPVADICPVLVQNSAAEHNRPSLSPSFCGSAIQKQLSRVFGVQGLERVQPTCGRGCGGRGQEGRFPAHSRRRRAPRGRSAYPAAPRGVGLIPAPVIQRRKKAYCLYDPASAVTERGFCCVPWVGRSHRQTNPGPLGGRNARECECQRAAPLEPTRLRLRLQTRMPRTRRWGSCVSSTLARQADAVLLGEENLASLCFLQFLSHVPLSVFSSPGKPPFSPLPSRFSQPRSLLLPSLPFFLNYLLSSLHVLFLSFSLMYSFLRKPRRILIFKMIARNVPKRKEEYESTVAL
ncbi:uncharacterized protein LOC116662195 [Camelus ferus]|uniref:Uncharacterized protein LOC116662195 n=1 Tax=Camelus ferus TaxID=419612 RepID=A0A8B8SP71_CAMFR|nr:uncharacterized protein LOC116662195 [Camelus ferus]